MTTSVKIKSIKRIKCNKQKVFDIEVPKNSNFILGNGLVVHNCKPYQYLKNTIYEQRIKIYKSQELIDELTDLERNINTGKVDHPVNGRKDVSDATCIEGSTEVFLTSGKHRTIKDLYDNGYDNEYILAYDIDKQSIVVEPIFKIINNGKKNTIKLTLDNGNELICTPDHKLLTRDGKYIEAKDSLDISLMPFNYEQKNMYRNRDYIYVYIPKNDLTNKGAYLHKLVAKQYHIKDKLSKEDSLQKNEWVVIHHKDVNRLNNNPDNLVYLTNVEHSKVHTSLNTTPLKRKQLSEFNKKTYARGEHPFAKMTQEQRRLNGSKSLTKWNKSERHRQLVSQKNQELLLEGQHPFQLYKEAAHSEKANKKRIATAIERYGGFGFNSSIIQQKCRASCLANNGYDNPWHSQEKQHEMQIIKLKNAFKKIVDKYKLEESNSMTYIDFKIYCYIEKFAVSSKEKDIKEAGLPIVSDNFEKDCKYFLKNIQIVGNFIRRFIKDTGKDKFTLSELIDYRDANIENNKKFKDQFNVSAIRNLDTNTILRLGFNLYNHRVVKIEPVGVHDVYDIQLADIHNFALLCGIFAHNCGATFTASKYAEEYAYDYGESYETFLEVNKDNSSLDKRQQIVVDLEKEMIEAGRKHNGSVQNVNENNNDAYIYDGIIVW